MSDATTPTAPQQAWIAGLLTWVAHVRLVFCAVVLWAGFSFVIDQFLMPIGYQRPPTLLVGCGGPLTALGSLLVVLVFAVIATALLPSRDQPTLLLALGLGLAAWSAGRGTIDDWLIMVNPAPGPATAAAYLPLLLEGMWLAVLVLATACVPLLLAPAGRRAPTVLSLLAQIAGGGSPKAAHAGPLALLATVSVAGVVVTLLSGPIVGATLRGQVYFAVFVGFFGGTLLARRLAGPAAPIWFWSAPIVLTLLGALLAVLQPGRFLGPEYAQLNIHPALGLVRPLPVEMIGVGLVGVCAALRMAIAEEAAAAARAAAATA